TAPVAAALADHVLGRARLTRGWVAGVAIAVAGVVVMSGGSWSLDALGWTLAIAAGCCFPVYASVLRELRSDRSELAAAATVFGGAVPLAVAGLVLTGADAPALGSESFTVLYLGLAATALAYLLWTYGLRLLTVRDTVLITMVEPITAAVLASVLVGERMSISGVVGIAAVAVGIAAAASRPPPSEPRVDVDTAREVEVIASAA
ncbi:MAG TPA: EamA family transporter, partial [Ilumatobacteraceae bacterium]